MPGLNTQLMLATARARFCSFQLRLPTVVGVVAPQIRIASAAASATPSTSIRQVTRGTSLSCPPALFLPASDDPRNLDMQRACSATVDAYLSRICDAIGQAHTAWRLRARLVQVAINAHVASGGNLQGAGLEPDIRQHAPREGSWERARSEAIAAGIGICWENWQRAVSVPGLPWYPGFAAFPGPMAPPTPNVPTPLVTVQNPVHLNSWRLKSDMLARYSGDNEWPGELFDAVAFGLERAFQTWAPSQMVMNVMGTGPVPLFAPPYVPVGSVVGGTGTQIAGAWSA
jgi:hypothetical protein